MSDLSANNFEQFMSACRGFVEGGRALNLSDIKNRFPRFADDLEEQLKGLRIAMQISKPGIGETISQYVLGETIASGGMGHVFLARNAEDGKRYAIKVLSLAEHKEGSRAERFMLETTAMTQLQHEHIVPVVDHGIHLGWPWLAMPYIDGISLDEILFPNSPKNGIGHQSSNGTEVRRKVHFSDFYEGQTEFQWIAKCGANIASGLAEAHAKGIIHRDIKPGNLILDHDGKIWIVDFGLVKFLDDEHELSRSGDMIGTPRYMSPEQFRGFVDQRSDVYSLGITLWEMVCKRKANEVVAANPRPGTSSAITSVQETNPQVPIELAEVIDMACSIDPSNRFSSAKELEQALIAASHGERTVFAKPRVDDSTKLAFARTLAVAVALLLVLLAAMYVFRKLDRSETNGRQAALVEPQSEFHVDENTTFIGKMPLPKSGRWTLDGPDATKFSFDHESQTLAFRDAPDFEFPDSQQGDNHYQVSVVPLGRRGRPVDETRELSIFVVDSNEPVELFNVERADRHTIEVFDGQLTLPLQSFVPVDPENQQWTARVSGGADASSFAVYDQRLVMLNLEPRDSPYEVVLEFYDAPPGIADIAIMCDSVTNELLLGDIGNHKVALLSPKESGLDPRFVRAMNCANGRDVKLFKVNDDTVEIWKLSLAQNLTAASVELIQKDCGLPNGLHAIASRDGVNLLVFGTWQFPSVTVKPQVRSGGGYVSRAVLDTNGTVQKNETVAFLNYGADIIGAEFVSENLVVLHTTDRSHVRLVDPVTLASIGSVKASTAYEVRGWTVLNQMPSKTNATRLNLSVQVKPPAVTVFKHDEFRGDSVPLGVGVYDYEQILAWSVVGNDAISSIMIREGYAVRVAEDNDGLGATQTFNSSISRLSELDNSISWIEVFRTAQSEDDSE